MTDLKTKYRTHVCGEIGPQHIRTRGEEPAPILLAGFVDRKLDDGTIWLRDRYGRTLVAAAPGALPYVAERFARLREEDVVQIGGHAALFPDRDPDLFGRRKEADVPRGAVCVLADRIEVLSPAAPVPPGILTDSDVAPEDRLTFRQLYLRRPEVRDRLALRSRAAHEAREWLVSKGFLELETPQLFIYDSVAIASEIVPAKAGRAFMLAGGPLVLDQYVRAGGFDRFFQIQRISAREEQDTPLHAQEYTGLDINMAYADVPDFCAVVEGLLAHVFKVVLGEDLPTPFLRLTHEQALLRYGTDTPDVRFGLELEAKEGGRGFRVPGGAGRITDGEIADLAAAAQGGASLAAKREGADLWVYAVGGARADAAALAAGAARLAIGKRLGLIDERIRTPVWITECPYFDIEDGEWTLGVVVFAALSGEESMKALLGKSSDDEKHRARSKGFDLVLDGVELGTGYLGNHDLPMQRHLWRTFLKLDHGDLSRMRAPVEAFRFGCPPYGELNIGFDRLIARMCGLDAIDEVMAFPKTYACRDLFLNAPSDVPLEGVQDLLAPGGPAPAEEEIEE